MTCCFCAGYVIAIKIVKRLLHLLSPFGVFETQPVRLRGFRTSVGAQEMLMDKKCLIPVLDCILLQDELINNVVLPHMCHIENDSDVAVRKCAVEILLSLAQTCSPLCFMDLIDIVEKVSFHKILKIGTPKVITLIVLKFV